MEHKCLKHPALYGSPSPGWSHDEDPCTCECTYCLEFKREHNLATIEDVEIEQLTKVIEGLTPGPWEDTQIKGFGAMNFIVTMSDQSQTQWHRVVAILENANFDTGRFIAWCRDGVPRLLRLVESLKQENEELKKDIERLQSKLDEP
jgi:hypothetical protein